MPETVPVKRDATWDIARGIGMALVIYGHLLEPIYPAHNGRPVLESAAIQWQIIYSFHMMLFFFVSGAVNRNLTKKAWPDTLRGSLRLLALAWIVHLLGALLDIVLQPQLRDSFWTAAWFVIDPILEGYKWSVGVLWFLTSLCCVQILAFATLRQFPALGVIIGAMAATALTPYLPEQFMMRTWAPGLSFFAVGYLVSQWQVRWTFWPAIPLFLMLIFLAPLNHGCAFSFSQTCGNTSYGPFGVQMFACNYGFLPLFFLSSLIGTLAIVCFSAGFRHLSASELAAYMGRKSLELFFINGFVATFLRDYFWGMEWPHLTPLHYVGLFIGINAAHLLALQVLRPVFEMINNASIWISSSIIRVSIGDDRTQAKAA
jgi:fucose 4-O-acetylase-like acetyltransferase